MSITPNARRCQAPRFRNLVGKAFVAGQLALLGLAAAPALANNPLVDPITNPETAAIPGNPNCQELGYDLGFKPQFDGSDANFQAGGLPGTYTIPGTSAQIEFTHGASHAPPGPESESYVGFISDLPIAGFIVKGGPNANLYDYDGNGLDAVFDDTDLTVPLNDNGQRPAISHVEVCLTFKLTMEKTAAGSFDRTFLWDIDKSASPASADIFFNDTQAFDYMIGVQNTGSADSKFAVNGTITLTNYFTGYDATGLTVADLMDDQTAATVDCAGATSVAGGAQLACSYSAAPGDATATLNTATADYVMHGKARSSSAEAGVSWTANPIFDSISITDNFDGQGPVPLGTCSLATEPCTFTLSQTLDCSDSGQKTNVAAITQTGQSDDATVALTCHELSVAKDATTAFTRQYYWNIQKQLLTATPLRVMEGQTLRLDYQAVVGLADPPFDDSDWSVGGNITVSNPAPIAATVNDVSDAFGGSPASVDCGTFPATIAAGGSLECTYAIDLDDAIEGTNTATATQQNFARAANGSTSPSGTTDYDGSAAVAFGEPTTRVDGCVNVTDQFGVDGNPEAPVQLGTVCRDADPMPQTFSYSVDRTWFQPGDSLSGICSAEIGNTASLDDAAGSSSGVTESILNEDCDTALGCTLTPGYWKTHSYYGPAPYDDNWLKVGDELDFGWGALALPGVCELSPEGSCGEDTPFFNDGGSWYDALWTPSQGNAYWIAAHAYAAATLNFLNGTSSVEEVDDAYLELTMMFEACTAADFAEKGNPHKPNACGFRRGEVIGWAGTLDLYNNGQLGIPHCSDDGR